MTYGRAGSNPALGTIEIARVWRDKVFSSPFFIGFTRIPLNKVLFGGELNGVVEKLLAFIHRVVNILVNICVQVLI